MAPPPPERRSGKFTERLSMWLVVIGGLGALIVLLDFKFTIVLASQTITVGSGFSPDLKGAVITAILISGYTAVKEYWLGSSAGSQVQVESISRIAEAAAKTNGEAHA